MHGKLLDVRLRVPSIQAAPRPVDRCEGSELKSDMDAFFWLF